MSEPILSPYAKPFLLPGGPHAVLLIHGFTGSPAHMLPLGRALNRDGFTVCGTQLSGHGTTIEEMMKCSWQSWLDDARSAYLSLRSAYETVSVGGLSMGGVLSLLLAEEQPEVNACVSLSAPMGMANPLGRFGHLLAPFVPVTHKHTDEERKLLDAEYDVGYDDIPTAKCHDLDILIRKARRDLGKVRCPVLCVQSEKDRAIIPASADIILNGVSSAERRRVTLQTSPHVITIGPEKERVFSEVSNFLTEHSPGKEQP